MKHLILLLSFTISINLSSQSIKEQSKTMSMGPHNCIYLEIDDTPKKVVESEWKKYLKEDFKKVNWNRKAKEFYTENGSVGVINGNKDITIYSKIEEGKGQVTLYTWTDLGDAIVSNSEHGQQAEGMNQYLSDFWIRAKKKGISIELDDEEDNLKKMKKDLVKLEKKNKKLHKNIESYKEKIRKAEADIEENLKAQDDQKVSIEQQMKVIEGVVERLNSVGKQY